MIETETEPEIYHVEETVAATVTATCSTFCGFEMTKTATHQARIPYIRASGLPLHQDSRNFLASAQQAAYNKALQMFDAARMVQKHHKQNPSCSGTLIYT